MCEWIITELGAMTPIHFTAFHPDYKLNQIASTKPSTLLKFRKIAMEAGIKYAYVGNISDSEGSNTYCHECGALLIKRSWYSTSITNLSNGKCTQCGVEIPGVFN
jgi:pyruvate formate lyase activating enzyme